MRSYWALGHRLPHFISAPLFGDRARFGHRALPHDADWKAWQAHYVDFYRSMQKQGIGKRVNDAGYQVLRTIDLSGKDVMELGPGILPHMALWNGKPGCYTLVDEKEVLLQESRDVLASNAIHAKLSLSTSSELSFVDGRFDVVLSFYCLEHVRPIRDYVEEIFRVLRPGGVLVGAIPTEGGLAWGVGRFLTSRRHAKRRMSVDLNKIICWEHQNFADTVLSELNRRFPSVSTTFWPFGIPLIDTNLIVGFVCQKGMAPAL